MAKLSMSTYEGTGTWELRNDTRLKYYNNQFKITLPSGARG